ncbi:MAG: metal-dependent hydrolase [Opitutaceae bacterium]|nr:metal-dependent hydrolase [Opitutaceae bacterium]
MDPVSHVVLGASLGYAAFSRRLGRTAAAAGGLAAFVPDADVFIRSATDPLIAIEYHRGFTHSFAFAPIGAAIVAALWLVSPAWRYAARWRPLWACCLLAYVSHILLDAATSYGTRLLWPFSDQRTGWDIISIIDPPFTLALLAGLIWALVRQHVRPAGIALTFAAAYLVAGGVQHARATSTQHALARSRGHTVERGEVMPTLGNNVIWRALYVHGGQIYSDRIRVGWFSSATVREGWSLPLVRESDLSPEERARNGRRSFQRFAWFSEHWVARSPRDAAVLADMRYTLSAEAFDPIWGIRFTAPGTANEVDWVNRSRDRQVSAKELWAEISGADARFRPLASPAQ